MRTNLAIVVKVCFEYILNICRIRGVYLVSQWAEQPVGFVLGSKSSHIVVQPIEVE